MIRPYEAPDGTRPWRMPAGKAGAVLEFLSPGHGVVIGRRLADGPERSIGARYDGRPDTDYRTLAELQIEFLGCSGEWPPTETSVARFVASLPTQ